MIRFHFIPPTKRDLVEIAAVFGCGLIGKHALLAHGATRPTATIGGFAAILAAYLICVALRPRKAGGA